MPLPTSNLRQVSTGAIKTGNNERAGSIDPSESSTTSSFPVKRVCSLSIHDDARNDVSVNLDHFPGENIKVGDLMQITASNDTANTSLDNDEPQSCNHGRNGQSSNNHDFTPSNVNARGSSQQWKHDYSEPASSLSQRYVFAVKNMSSEQKTKRPDCQVSVSRRIAAKFGLKSRSKILFTSLDQPVDRASHVEVIFRDEYLTRADMWRLVVAVLSNKMIYKGQRIWFMGTIKALVQTIFVQGQKVQSAFFDASTKPIFRSESARYVLFIQMSKEMWDFDADSTGEIMFSKVINGFLPELFGRWKQRNVKHLISIVLFTRLIYERPHTKEGSSDDVAPSFRMQATSYQDFYRVVVSDMAGWQWDEILNQLKSEFKIFLRDVSISRPANFQYEPLENDLSALSTDSPEFVIAGSPSTAMRGNILEAINLASSQFSCDHIDRDLVRTGVSIVIITPGTGVFEVDYRLLVQTTEKLIENGVGIDLVCLSRMPLHSIPLFRYWHPSNQVREGQNTSNANNNGRTGDLLPNSVTNISSPIKLFSAPNPLKDVRSCNGLSQDLTRGCWLYGIPHWIDVSFWTSSEEYQDRNVHPGQLVSKVHRVKLQRKAFIPRVRMYQMQMMGVLEDGMSNISISHFPGYTPTATLLFRGTLKSQTHHADDNVSALVRRQLHTPEGLHFGTTVRVEAHDTSITRNDHSSYEWMDEYDSTVFCHPKHTLAKEISIQKTRDRYKMKKICGRSDHSSSLEDIPAFGSPVSRRKYDLERRDSSGPAKSDEAFAQSVPKNRAHLHNTVSSSKEGFLPEVRASRQMSFGPRGFAGALKASASTEITAEHAKSGLSSGRGSKVRSSVKSRNSGRLEPNSTGQVRKPDESSSHLSPGREEASHTFNEGSQGFSKPISIGNFAVASVRDNKEHLKEIESSSVHNFRDGSNISATMKNHVISSDLATSIDTDGSKIALSPGSSLAPWLTILNPSNPRQMNINLAYRLGRWQHIFPRPLRASKIKWKSLCSPAAVPLTTEDFPTYAQITAEYDERNYEVLPLQHEELSENSRSSDWLRKEMVAFRFTQGFQVVVGSRIEQTMKLVNNQTVDIFEDDMFSMNGSTIFMSRGNLIHQLSYLEGGGTAVRCLTRRTMASPRSDYFESTPNIYKPIIRTMHAQIYSTQVIDISPERAEPLWETIDSSIACHQHPQREPIKDQIRSWRARFVLIPVDPPQGGRYAVQSGNEDNEEEARLEGIRKLSQTWQRFRYAYPNDSRIQVAEDVRRETNPLDITYRTQNPSTIVEAELESVSGSDLIGQPLQLLSDSDLYQRSNLDFMSLAQVMQSEKGVRMMDRRWHLRLHYKCFVGFEFTTWLLENFRDIASREEAVEFGNELMKGGLFKHVERRHQFRDGNFFYQITSEYHAPTRSWLGKPDVSIPSTPWSENVSQDTSNIQNSKENKSGVTQEDPGISNPLATKPRLGVALSKSLLIDVDIRKRSHRPELVTLHYDRLHNPDNCYHILLEWMNCTAKLIEDAVVSWATIVERFGLRLVELPLGEASGITKLHPFRGPTLVRLAVRPPAKLPKIEKHVYQKAILKKFQFVLDLEAATDFPPDVDVTYSWGKPSYTYPQYIHRSGVTLAQITNDGEFILLANRLYNNRSSVPRESDKPEALRASSKYSPVQGGAQPGPSQPSPHLSPAARAVHEGSSLSGNYPRFTSPTASITTEQILEEFETFCHDPAALDQFFNQILKKTLSPNESSHLEADVPTLGSPPSSAPGEASSS